MRKEFKAFFFHTSGKYKAFYRFIPMALYFRYSFRYLANSLECIEIIRAYMLFEQDVNFLYYLTMKI